MQRVEAREKKENKYTFVARFDSLCPRCIVLIKITTLPYVEVKYKEP